MSRVCWSPEIFGSRSRARPAAGGSSCAVGARSTGIERAPLEIEADFDAIWPTLDRGHVALRRARDQSLYDLYSLESGARIITLERPVEIAVVGSTALATVLADRGISLVAREARTGRTLWLRLVWREPRSGARCRKRATSSERRHVPQRRPFEVFGASLNFLPSRPPIDSRSVATRGAESRP